MWLNALVCAAAFATALNSFISTASLKSKLKRKEAEAALLSVERQSERKGRTKAERQLRELQLQLAQLSTTTLNEPNQQNLSFPLRPIGFLNSCFDTRNGTPRQPLLVPGARSALTLRPELTKQLFDGLDGYSHCWVLYIFHENTDLQRLWSDPNSSIKAKIRVPRLNGEKLGVFATRSPHRPCPIGLSVAQIIRIQGNTLILGGADIVNGSPILDIKPYVPFCDHVETATAPLWVAPTAEDEPLEISSVELPPTVDENLKKSWEESNSAKTTVPLYSSYEEYRDLVLQVLSRDIRSVTQRVKVPAREQLKVEAGGGVLPSLASNNSGQEEEEEEEEGKWHVELCGVDITYEVAEDVKKVMVKTAKRVVKKG